MNRYLVAFVGVFILFAFLVFQAHAIKITKARIQSGQVVVQGIAATNADIRWEGQLVTTSKRRGFFKFSTLILPQDCIGELGDGVELVQVVLSGCNVNLEGRVAELEAKIAALLQVVNINETTGEVTLQSDADLHLQAGGGGMIELMNDAMVMGKATLEGDVDMMQAATVMGTSELEGNVMMMQGATVMGTSELEGNVMMMQDATVMGDADLKKITSIEGTLILSEQVNEVVDGVLTPSGSTVLIVDPPLPLVRITPTGNDGTILELRFVFSGQVPEPQSVIPCDPVCNAGGSNIRLKPGTGNYQAQDGDSLRLVSEGDFWRELSRSTGHVKVYSLKRAVTVSAGNNRHININCSQGPPTVQGQGFDGATILFGSVRAFTGGGPNETEVDIPINDRIEPIPTTNGPFSEIYRVTATNDLSVSVTLAADLRCILI